VVSVVTIERLAGDRGFSMVELLIGSVVTLLVLGAALTVTTQIQQGYTTQLDRAGEREEARFAADWLARELRQAGTNPYGVTVSACPAANTNFLPIRIDPDGDGVNDDIRVNADVNPPNQLLGGSAGACIEADEDVTISHDPATRMITRFDNNVDAAPVPVTDSVITQLQFTYLDANRVWTVNPAAVAFVQILVTAQARRMNPQTGQFDTFTAGSEVRLRAR